MSDTKPDIPQERLFPILKGPAIPWSVIAPYEAQAMENHSQSLERLAERGGLCACEAIDVLMGQRWKTKHGPGEIDKMLSIVAARQGRPSRETVDKLVEALRFLSKEDEGIDPIVPHWSHTADWLQCPRCLIDAALSAYESETKR